MLKKEKTIDLLERILLNHALISSIHFKKPLPALQKLNAEIEQHIRELKNIPSGKITEIEQLIRELKHIPSAPSDRSETSDPSKSEVKR